MHHSTHENLHFQGKCDKKKSLGDWATTKGKKSWVDWWCGLLRQAISSIKIFKTKNSFKLSQKGLLIMLIWNQFTVWPNFLWPIYLNSKNIEGFFKSGLRCVRKRDKRLLIKDTTDQNSKSRKNSHTWEIMHTSNNFLPSNWGIVCLVNNPMTILKLRVSVVSKPVSYRVGQKYRAKTLNIYNSIKISVQTNGIFNK